MKTRAILVCVPIVLVACADDPSTPSSDMQIYESCLQMDGSQCIEYGYEVTLPNNPSADVSAACNRELAQIASCGYSTPTTPLDCDRYAATELPSLSTCYDCVAQLPCSSLGDATALQGCGVPPSTVGDALCASFASACPSDGCSSSDQTALDVDGAWVRSDALDALDTCLSQPSCDDTLSCIEAWRAAVE